MRPIRLVTFDALHTIITPRNPIHVQYSQVFEPYVGTLPPEKIKQSFKVALKAVQKDYPSYNKGAEDWWRDVIRRTALASGADERSLDSHLSDIVQKLMTRFSSKEGYAAFDDAIPTIRRLHDEFGVRSAIISNGDSRLRLVMKDLGFPSFLDPMVLSEEVSAEKPSQEIFVKTLALVNEKLGFNEPRIEPDECLHVGDELIWQVLTLIPKPTKDLTRAISDYDGGVEAGFDALLLRRQGTAGEQEHKEACEDLEGVGVIDGLGQVMDFVQRRRA